MLNALTADHSCSDFGIALNKKLRVTFKSLDTELPIIGASTFDCLKSQSSFVKMCWLKTVIGGWCTGVRMCSYPHRKCIFGCSDQRDELCHYLVCPALWQIARTCLRVEESSVEIFHRVCIVDPTETKFKTLAFCHALYHCCVNDTQCVGPDGTPSASHIVQHQAYENAHHCLHYLRGR